MTLQQLKYFIEIVNAGSMNRHVRFINLIFDGICAGVKNRCAFLPGEKGFFDFQRRWGFTPNPN